MVCHIMLVMEYLDGLPYSVGYRGFRWSAIVLVIEDLDGLPYNVGYRGFRWSVI